MLVAFRSWVFTPTTLAKRAALIQTKADAGDALNSKVHRDVGGIPELGIHTNNAGKESGVDTDLDSNSVQQEKYLLYVP
jgi:hypothetical protein